MGQWDQSGTMPGAFSTGRELDKWNSYNRTVDNVLIEWDRRIIWIVADTDLYALEAPALGNAGHP